MQTITIDLIPQDELPIIKVSQFNDNWDIKFIITENGEEVQVHPDDMCTCVIRKPDNNIVTIEADTLYGNGVKIALTEQACACYGKALGELVIESVVGGIAKRVGTCNFILDVEISPEYGGLVSTSEINNLKRQIDTIINQDAGPIVEELAGPIVEALVPEVIGENYYTKAEIESNYYSKSEIDLDIEGVTNKALIQTLLAGQTSIIFNTNLSASDIVDFKINEPGVNEPAIIESTIGDNRIFTLTFDAAFDHDVNIMLLNIKYEVFN